MGLTFFGFVVFRETDGDGVGRILEASGNADLLNNCFKLLRCRSIDICVSRIERYRGRQSVLKSEGDRLENEEVRGYMLP